MMQFFSNVFYINQISERVMGIHSSNLLIYNEKDVSANQMS